MRLAGKKAVVTGAATGIGAGCAMELARAGADLVVNDLAESPALAATLDELGETGRTAIPILADVFDRAGCEQLVARAVEALGRIDILISNPAYTVREKFLDFDPDQFRRVIQGTLISGFDMAQLVAREMVKQGQGGKIVFISSVHAEMAYARSAGYNAAKAGLNHLARTIAIELASHRINVNCIEPGWINTPGERKLFTEEQIQAAGAALPWGRLGEPAEIGKAVVYLASADAEYVTGTMLQVDGGYLLKDAT